MKNKYLAKREELLKKYKDLIEQNASDEETKEVENAINKLDTDYKKASERMANLNALKDVTASAFKNTAGVIGEMNNISTTDDEQIYADTVFPKVMLNRKLSTEETAIFGKFNNNANTAAGNSVIIPKSIATKIWSRMTEQHPILADVFSTNYPGEMEFIIGSVANDAEWYDETEDLDDSATSFTTLKLGNCELIKKIPITWKMDELAIEDFNPWLIRELGNKNGNALAAAYVSGLGKPGDSDTFKDQPLGVVTKLEASDTAQIVGYADNEGVTYTEITTARSKIASGYKPSIYAKSETIWKKIANILDKNGRPLFIPDVTGGGVGNIFGIIVKEEAAVADDGILFGDYVNGYKSNIAKSLTIKRFEKPRLIDMVSYMIVDGAPIDTKAFAYICPDSADDDNG